MAENREGEGVGVKRKDAKALRTEQKTGLVALRLRVFALGYFFRGSSE
jgi:hypothetical protein